MNSWDTDGMNGGYITNSIFLVIVGGILWMENSCETMGDRIRFLRKMRGLSQEALAEIIDVSIKHLSKIERDEVVFSVEILKKIALYFNVSSDYILRGGNQKISKAEIIQWIENYYDEKGRSERV